MMMHSWTTTIPKHKKSTLTTPIDPLPLIFVDKTLWTSYWDIDEWIWVLTLVICSIWKNDIFSTGTPNIGSKCTYNFGYGARIKSSPKDHNAHFSVDKQVNVGNLRKEYHRASIISIDTTNQQATDKWN